MSVVQSKPKPSWHWPQGPSSTWVKVAGLDTGLRGRNHIAQGHWLPGVKGGGGRVDALNEDSLPKAIMTTSRRRRHLGGHLAYILGGLWGFETHCGFAL